MNVCSSANKSSLAGDGHSSMIWLDATKSDTIIPLAVKPAERESKMQELGQSPFLCGMAVCCLTMWIGYKKEENLHTICVIGAQ